MRTCATLFSGGGLADVGLRAAGYRPVFAVEYDEAIAGVYAANHGPHVVCGRVEELDYRPLAGLDLGWASPPCINASVAKTDAGETLLDQQLARGVCRFIEQARPRAFALENVSGYARFVAFGLILGTLRECGYALEWSVLNSADYGVPQSRKRLILRARRDVRQIEPLRPTHAEYRPCGGLFDVEPELLPWVGWYEAIEDLIASLPESRFAEWQLKRLPPELTTCLVTNQGDQPAGTEGRGPRRFAPGDPCGPVLADSCSRTRAFLTYEQNASREPTVLTGIRPAATVGCHSPKHPAPKAFLVESKNANQQYGDGLRHPHEPATTVVTDPKPSHRPKALLIQGTSTLDVREGEEPSPSVVATVQQKAAVPKAVLVAGNSNERSWGENCRSGESPAFATTPNAGGRVRAAVPPGRVVAMTARALARFQSVPDSYVLPEKNALAYRIVGNGVPCLLSQRIGESLR